MRRLVVTGFPCSKEPWRRLFPENDIRILTLAEVMEESQSHDLRKMAEVVLKVIQSGGFRTVIAHDIGVTTSLLALARAVRKGTKELPTKVVLFNGAFSHFSVFEAPHPLWIQLKSQDQIESELSSLGVHVDPHLRPRLVAVKKMYRLIILASLAQGLRAVLRRNPVKLRLPFTTLILEGTQDPFIPRSSIDDLEKLFPDVRRVQAYAGHFPYQASVGEIRALIDAFDRAP